MAVIDVASSWEVACRRVCSSNREAGRERYRVVRRPDGLADVVDDGSVLAEWPVDLSAQAVTVLDDACYVQVGRRRVTVGPVVIAWREHGEIRAKVTLLGPPEGYEDMSREGDEWARLGQEMCDVLPSVFTLRSFNRFVSALRCGIDASDRTARQVRLRYCTFGDLLAALDLAESIGPEGVPEQAIATPAPLDGELLWLGGKVNLLAATVDHGRRSFGIVARRDGDVVILEKDWDDRTPGDDVLFGWMPSVLNSDSYRRYLGDAEVARQALPATPSLERVWSCDLSCEEISTALGLIEY